MPKISVIMPVYKVEPYLRRCIESILVQTYTDFELILVDDGSPDGCPAICDEYAQKDPRIVVIHQENGGSSAARNAGLDIASGEFIGFVDSDDQIKPEMYEALLQVIEAEKADVVECNFSWGSWEGQSSKKIYSYSGTDALLTLFSKDRLGDGLTTSVTDKIYRAESIRSARFLSGCRYMEDFEFIVRFFFNTGKIVKYDRFLYSYTINDHSLMHGDYKVFKAAGETMANRSIFELFESRRSEAGALYDIMLIRYADVMFDHFHKCYQRRKAPEMAAEAKSLRADIKTFFRQHKGEFEKRLMLKYFLLRLSPRLYCFFADRKGK